MSPLYERRRGLYYCFAFGIAILIATSASALPTRKDTADIQQPWWFDSCSTLTRTRHSRSAHNVIQDQVKIVLSNLDIIKNDIQILFPDDAIKDTPASYSWLKTQNYLRQMRKDKPNALSNFHKSLQRFAGTFLVLNTSEIDTPGDTVNVDIGHFALDLISHELQRLLCEIETELNASNLPPPRMLRLKEMKIDLPKVVDVTQASMQYFGILQSYGEFLKKGSRILFGKKRRAGKGNKKKKNGGKRKAARKVKKGKKTSS